MGGGEGNPDPALQSFVTGINTPTAEGGMAFFSPRLPPLFLFVRILDVRQKIIHNGFRIQLEVTFCGFASWFYETDFEDRSCTGGAASHRNYLDLCGSGLCIRLGVGASQHGDRPVGRGGSGDILPAKRPHSAGDCVPHQPVWTAAAGILAAG